MEKHSIYETKGVCIVDRNVRIALLIVICTLMQIVGFACAVYFLLAKPVYAPVVWIIVSISGFAGAIKELVVPKTTSFGTLGAFVGLMLIGISISAVSVSHP